MNYFDLAADLARQQLLEKLQMDALRASFRRMAEKDRREKSLDEINAEELDCFDRAEARAINGGF